MKAALISLVQSAKYLRFELEGDVFAPRIGQDTVWRLIERIVTKCGPILLLLRLADSNAPTLCKIKGTLEYLKTKFVDTGSNSLEDKICVAFNNRAPEFECDIASAAYVLDPQFIKSSRMTPRDVMRSFWEVSRNVLGVKDDDRWTHVRRQLVTELTHFRMRTGGFSYEDYDTENAVEFWGVAGCHAPTLRKLAFHICSLPSSSGAAERNWQELKQNYTKTRNRLGKTRLEKMVFVRKFIRMKRQLCHNEDTTQFKGWAKELLNEAAAALRGGGGDDDDPPSDGDVPDERHDDVNDVVIFQDRIEPGEMGKVNGQEPGEDRVSLRQLRRDHGARSWLFNKYYNRHFLDKDPDGVTDNGELSDDDEWEHRVVKNVVWWKFHGHAVETCLKDAAVGEQSIMRYLINDSLIEMIRDSPHNKNLVMASTQVADAATAAAATTDDAATTESAGTADT